MAINVMNFNSQAGDENISNIIDKFSVMPVNA